MDIAASLRDATESHRAGRLDEAEALLRSVLAHDPAHARALFQLGVIELSRGRPAEAESLLRRATTSARNAVATMALADAIEQQGRSNEAEGLLREAVAIDASLAEAWSRLSALCAHRGAHDEGIWALAAATRLKPRDARLWSNLAAIQLAAGRYDEAEGAARRAIEIAPTHALAWTNLGRALGMKGDEAGARKAIGEAVARDPQLGDAHYWLAVSLARAGAWTEALGHYRQAMGAMPRWAEPRIGAGNVLAKLGRRREAVEAFAEAARLDPSHAAAIESQRLFMMQFGDEYAPLDVSAAHRAWGERYAAAAPRRARTRSARPRLRIGYVSPRFQVSSMAFALLPVMGAHDRSRFEVYCYAERETEDATSAQFRAVSDQWRETQDLDDAALAALIEADDIDVLVDLAGHTPGNRLRVFARRPARAAVSWLDYFNTTGVAAIDTVVADDVALATPLDQSFVEELASVGPVRYPYAAPGYAPAVTPPNASGVTFGSFARWSKITESALDTWAAILERVPGSRLLLKNDSLDDEPARGAVLAAFERRGIGAARLELRGASPHERMLAELREVDIVLDTFPYNGGITTLEALWMGRPVITLRGDTLVGRQGAAILCAVDLGDLVAADLAAYRDLAVTLAGDAARRIRLAQTLREALVYSALGDVPAFTRRLEALFEARLRAALAHPGGGA